MGKKKRLNRFITRWIKSDLPDDRSTVLLLGVTRIPTTPTAARRPCSLPLGTSPSLNPFPQNNPIAQHKSRKNSFSSRKGSLVRRNSSGSHRNTSATRRNNSEQNCVAAGSSNAQNSKSRHVAFGSQSSSTDLSSPCLDSADSSDKQCSVSGSDDITTPSNVNSSDFTPGPMMDRSVDSIGACSLDADASVNITDWSEQSSVGTLRSVSLPTPEPQPHLPSYLSLACTVSGYSTTTNYDPERLARSRDASPHRLYDDLNSQGRNTPVYSIRNNLLSPPNVVPLPHHKFTSNITPGTPKNSQTMEDQIVTRREFYSSSTRSTSFMSKESRSFVTSMFSSDSIDGCIENGHQNGIQSKCVSYETKNTSYITNGTGRSLTENTFKEFANGVEKKSFIQQRVERLYGPGALAQGFFISKRQKNRSSESETEKNSKTSAEDDKHSKSMTEKLLESSAAESNLKQSTSSPTLPVLRHLRPEFRAQLPIINPKKGSDCVLPKSVTIPTLKEETKLNGHSKSSGGDMLHLNGNQNVITKEDLKDDALVKDGHYFINILERESERLLQLAEIVEKDLIDDSLPEEITGKLRSAAGKARLLTSQKMQQFKGLCTNNITQREGEAFPTTNEDLQGFWDMVLLQVEQVDMLFKDIDTLRANDWREIEVTDTVDKPKSNGNTAKPRKIASRTKPLNSVNEEARKEREAKRKQMIEERRKAMREQKQKPQESIEIFVPESS